MKNILLCVTGLSPQVITETLYALKDSNDFPQEVHILGTGEGIRRAKLELLNEGRGHIEKLCSEYELPIPLLQPANFHCVTNEAGEPLFDMQTEQDHQDTSNLLFDVIRKLTTSEKIKLHVSLAGGRKTMGFYAGYILSLVGRSQDCLSHVIVDQDFEGHPDFFYPPKKQTVIHHRVSNKPMDASQATVTLAYIPIVKLNGLLPETEVAQSTGFTDLVERTQPFVDRVTIEADFESSELLVNQIPIKLDRLNFIWYIWLMARHLSGKERVGPLASSSDYQTVTEEFSWFYSELLGEFGGDDRTLSVFEQILDDKFVRERQSRVNKALAIAFGQQKAEQIGVVNTGKRGARTIEILLDTDLIKSLSLQKAASLLSGYFNS